MLFHLLLVFLTVSVCLGENAEMLCAGQAWAPSDPAVRHYVRDREIDVRHVSIDVTPDFKARTIQGQVTIKFAPIAKPLVELSLDAMDLNIHSVTSDKPVQTYQNTGEKLVVTFAQPIAPETEASVTMSYNAEPKRGLYFRTPEMGYKPGEAHLYTQGEAIEARYWYPCYDAPNEKFTSDVTCHVPEGMTVLSNGRLISETTTAGVTTGHWLQDKPHANYLISLVAGPFKKVEGKHRDIPLAFYTLPSEIEQAPNSFRETADAMEFFEKEIGVPYPWAKYAQVCVNDFQFGGMENTSITTLTDSTLFKTNTENIDSSAGLVAHELAHQWFGDLVTTKDWSHLWLNEGFATYYAALYTDHLHGRDEFRYTMHQTAQGLAARAADARPIVYREYDVPDDMVLVVGHLIYGKGSWVLHMLRSQLGADLYRKCIKTYVERNQFNSATTESLNTVIEELSGRSFDRFFDQWVYHGTVPLLNAAYSWDEKTKLARVTLNQTQPTNQNALQFELPLKIRFITKDSATNVQVTLRNRSEDFYFPLSQAPSGVRFDPDTELLAKITFHPPPPMLQAQLTNRQDVVGRLLAVDEFAAQRSREAIKALAEALRSDPFHAVRRAASRALREIHTDEAFAALTNSLAQTDARVRLQVASDCVSFYKPEAFALGRSLLKTERNPAIQAAILRSLAGDASADLQPFLLEFMKKSSYENVLGDAAIHALRELRNPAAAPAIMDWISGHQQEFTSRGIANSVQAVAFLSRDLTNKAPVRDFLERYALSSRKSVQRAAFNALGTLGDEQAIPMLDKFASGAANSPEKEAAEKAAATLRAGRKPIDDFGAIRGELSKVQKENADLRKEMNDLKKRFDSFLTAPKASEPVKPVKKPKK